MKISRKKTAPTNYKELLNSSLSFFKSHRFVLVIIIIGAALSFALIKTRSAIDISRNEERYTEEVSKIKYKEIDQETLENFKLAEEDRKVEVNSNFAPDRNNPFTE